MISRVDGGSAFPTPAIAAKDARDAAVQFEALLIAQMLRTARGVEGWLGTGDDSTAQSAMEMAEEQFASAMATQGGIGLARLVTEGLKVK